MPGPSYGPPRRHSYVPPPPPSAPPLVPSPAEPGDREYMNSFGRIVVQTFLKSENKFPGGFCCQVSYERVREGSLRIGRPMPPYISGARMPVLWAGMNDSPLWSDFPEEVRGAGGAGAVAWASSGRLLRNAGIWAGRLRPGAVVQTWQFASDYERVRRGERAVEGKGHSFIFLGYRREAGSITGMVIADHTGPLGETYGPALYQTWFGCNLPFHGFSNL